MYWPGTNYKANERIRQKRVDAWKAEHAAWLARVRAALIGATIQAISNDDVGDPITIEYQQNGRQGKIVVDSLSGELTICNNEKEW